MIYIALLRGINVSGKNVIKKPQLDSIISSLGFNQFRSYIQSGNIVFESEEKDSTKLSQSIAEALKTQANIETWVFCQNLSTFSNQTQQNPFLKSENPKQLYYCFTNLPVDISSINSFDGIKFNGDQLKGEGNVLYLNYKNGAGKTKLNNQFIERHFNNTCTCRNQNTVSKLIEIGLEMNIAD